jgi:hypothetical protein
MRDEAVSSGAFIRLIAFFETGMDNGKLVDEASQRALQELLRERPS